MIWTRSRRPSGAANARCVPSRAPAPPATIAGSSASTSTNGRSFAFSALEHASDTELAQVKVLGLGLGWSAPISISTFRACLPDCSAAKAYMDRQRRHGPVAACSAAKEAAAGATAPRAVARASRPRQASRDNVAIRDGRRVSTCRRLTKLSAVRLSARFRRAKALLATEIAAAQALFVYWRFSTRERN
jgi:hypothetical protein